jgi:hypothetical protein
MQRLICIEQLSPHLLLEYVVMISLIIFHLMLSIQISNLLPGTTYSVRVRALDRATKTNGPWTSVGLQATTKGVGVFCFCFLFI